MSKKKIEDVKKRSLGKTKTLSEEENLDLKNLKKNIINLKKEVKKLKDELKDKTDKLLRSYADFQNYQKRVEKDLIVKEKEIKKEYISEIIDVMDLLKKAYEDKNPKHGLKLILGRLEEFLKKEKIKCYDSVGSKFDHRLHHAVTTIEKNGYKDGEIVEEIKKGFMMEDVVLRPAYVIVAKKQKK